MNEMRRLINLVESAEKQGGLNEGFWDNLKKAVGMGTNNPSTAEFVKAISDTAQNLYNVASSINPEMGLDDLRTVIRNAAGQVGDIGNQLPSNLREYDDKYHSRDDYDRAERAHRDSESSWNWNRARHNREVTTNNDAVDAKFEPIISAVRNASPGFDVFKLRKHSAYKELEQIWNQVTGIVNNTIEYTLKTANSLKKQDRIGSYDPTGSKQNDTFRKHGKDYWDGKY